MSRYYRQPVITQIDVNEAVALIQAQLNDLNLLVRPNGPGWRIECTVRGCGWSKCHDNATNAIVHAATH